MAASEPFGTARRRRRPGREARWAEPSVLVAPPLLNSLRETLHDRLRTRLVAPCEPRESAAVAGAGYAAPHQVWGAPAAADPDGAVEGADMLGSYRVLDLTDDRGQLASFILATIGAEVILVEPPGGSAARRRGPFARGEAPPEHPLTFWAWNRGKRSVVLALTPPAGTAELARLAAAADVVFESGAVPVDLAALRAA